MAAWIFQGNPKNFDIDDYVARYPELIYWRTPRHVNDIAVGDRCFLWRAGADAGAIAIGTVVELPTPRRKVHHPEALGDDLWRVDPPNPEESSTGIHLDDVRLTAEEGYIPRSAVMEDNALKSASIIKIPNGSVFRLDAYQSAALERLWGLAATDNITAGVISSTEGHQVLRAHRSRERAASLRNKKLAQLRAVHGKYVCALCGIDESTQYPVKMSARIFEVHHLAPLAQALTPVRTTLDDLAVLCANCHRAVHATEDVEANYQELMGHLQQRANPK